GDDGQISIENTLVQVDVERDESLSLGHRAGGKRLLQLYPQIARRSPRAGELEARCLASRKDRRRISRHSQPGADDNRLFPKMKLHREPRVLSDLIRAHAIVAVRRSSQVGPSALIAE